MAYPFGQAVRLSSTIIGDSGPTNPATLILTVTLPDTTTAVFNLAAFTLDSTGLYHLDYLPTLAGIHNWRIVATNPNTAAEGTFSVDAVGAHFADPVALDYIKAHLNMSGITIDDAELLTVVDAAVDLAEDFIGPIKTRSITEVHMMNGTNAVALNSNPVASVQSVTTSSGLSFSPVASPGGFYYLLQGGTLNLFTAYGLGWYPEFSQINFNSGFVTITVAYTAGRPVLSPKLKLAVAELTRHLWQTQQGSRSRQSQPTDYASPVPGATTKFAMELFGKAALAGIG